MHAYSKVLQVVLMLSMDVNPQIANTAAESAATPEMHVKIEDVDGTLLDVQPSALGSLDVQGPAHQETNDRATSGSAYADLRLDPCFDERDYR